ncbi:hypothetical protein CLV98_11218 [Dyadobacter jejuensis]|uniref:Uncharacterized protein n=1 Tax=Dyadobacter jejuensis TaxID=1082580 RepID=A0A316AG83_9BACT|nr:hypothetical protein [Dyadobacter jejuensis]PWJ55924.1 hypothetical protein CLV98_11218 [Dyadobacter jejuensis]
MKTDPNKKMMDLFDSMRNSQRAEPRPQLKEEIRQKIMMLTDETVIPISQWRYMAAAAAVLLVLNLSVFVTSLRSNAADQGVLNSDSYAEQSLVSNYKLYE